LKLLTADPSVPRKTKTAEDKTQPSPESRAPATTKKTGKRQSGRRATTAKKARKPNVARDTTIEPSEDTIRLRAYFISERRRRFALPGDAESDWLEAKRQLLAEARR
jgi:hypothetical protein